MVDTLNKIQCEICGIWYKQITSTHLKFHEITLLEYKNLYPNSPIVSPETSQKLINTNKKKWSNLKYKENVSKAISKTIKDQWKNDKYNRIQSEDHKRKRAKSQSETKQTNPEKYRGKDAGNWRGGISYEPYCSKFNNQLKQSIRNRYNNCDYISGIHKDICNKEINLSVHHVNYDKDCGCNEVKCELIPLSRSNHIRTNANRSFWNRLFKYSLEIDKEYYKVIK